MRSSTASRRLAGPTIGSRVQTIVQSRAGLGLVLALVTLITRLPWVGSYFYQWDSINFALALGKFDVAAGQPQVPGYLLYVALGRIAYALAGTAKWGFVGISLVSSMLATVALLELGSVLFNRRVGLIASLLLASSPLFWFYGELALPHALDAFMVIGLAWGLYHIRRGQVQWVVPAAVWLALAGGLRPQTELFLFPLAIYSGARLPRKHIIIGLGVLALVNALWLVPLIALSGGLSRYVDVSAAYAQSFNQASSVLDGAGMAGLVRNLTKLGLYTSYGLASAGLTGLIGAIVSLGRRRPGKGFLSQQQAIFLAIWILPALGYYVLIHMGQQGLVFVFLPALLLLAGRLLDFSSLSSRAVIALTTLGILLNGVIFLGLPTFPVADQRVKLLTVDTLRRNDAYLSSRIETIQSKFKPENTLVVSSDWRFVQYYLPQYRYTPYVLGGRWESNAGQPALTADQVLNFTDLGLVPDASGRVQVVLFEPALTSFAHFSEPRLAFTLPDGETLSYFNVEADKTLVLGLQGIGDNVRGDGQ